MKLRPVGAESFHADRQTDGWTYVTNTVVSFQDFAKAPKNNVHPYGDGAFNCWLCSVMYFVTTCWLNVLVFLLTCVRQQCLLNQQFIFSALLNRPLSQQSVLLVHVLVAVVLCTRFICLYSLSLS